MKKITYIMVIITLLLSFGMTIFQNPLLANTENKKEEFRDKYLNIMAVTKPEAEMVKRIVGNKHNVQYMISDESDIRNYKYTKESVDNVSNMDLFLYSDTDFEPWVSGFIGKLKKGNLGIINLSRGIRFLNYVSESGNKENPYYFTGLEEYKIALYNVKNCIQEKDPKNRDYYEKNYDNEIKRLNLRLKDSNENISYLKDYIFLTYNHKFDYILKNCRLNYKNLNNEYIDVFIKDNKLDPKKVIIVQDGENKIELEKWILNNEVNDTSELIDEVDYNQLNQVELWKYYNGMPFDDLIVYNLKQISNLSLEEQKKADSEVLQSKTSE